MTELLLATRSYDKAREIRRILAPRGIHVRTLADAGIDPAPDEDDIEVFDSFRENALAKARYFREKTGTDTLADDSGIVVPALGNAPGVRSKRFAGRFDLVGSDLDAANNRTLLDRLAENGGPRDAYYVCAAALLRTDGTSVVAIGTVAGSIADAPIGSGGFGYDPLFFLPALGCTFGQIDPAAKDRLSHRGRAFSALATTLVTPLPGVDHHPPHR